MRRGWSRTLLATINATAMRTRRTPGRGRAVPRVATRVQTARPVGSADAGRSTPEQRPGHESERGQPPVEQRVQPEPAQRDDRERCGQQAPARIRTQRTDRSGEQRHEGEHRDVREPRRHGHEQCRRDRVGREPRAQQREPEAEARAAEIDAEQRGRARLRALSRRAAATRSPVRPRARAAASASAAARAARGGRPTRAGRPRGGDWPRPAPPPAVAAAADQVQTRLAAASAAPIEPKSRIEPEVGSQRAPARQARDAGHQRDPGAERRVDGWREAEQQRARAQAAGAEQPRREQHPRDAGDAVGVRIAEQQDRIAPAPGPRVERPGEHGCRHGQQRRRAECEREDAERTEAERTEQQRDPDRERALFDARGEQRCERLVPDRPEALFVEPEGVVGGVHHQPGQHLRGLECHLPGGVQAAEERAEQRAGEQGREQRGGPGRRGRGVRGLSRHRSRSHSRRCSAGAPAPRGGPGPGTGRRRRCRARACSRAASRT